MTNIERIKNIISEELRIDKDKIVPEAHVFDDLNFDSLEMQNFFQVMFCL